MIEFAENNSYGARPVRSLQAGAVPGLPASKGPTQATGGPSQLSWGAGGQEKNATGQPISKKSKKESTSKVQPLKIMHWNAEGVNSKKDGFSKRLELEKILFEEKISICCIQETHLTKDVAFKVRGYQCFRNDRKDRKKGGILTLVRNNLRASEVHVLMEGAEYHLLHILTDRSSFHVLNYYCPNDRPLSLDTVARKDKLIVCGDFNSHSQSWGYDHMDKRGEEVEAWQDELGLLLINQPTDAPTFYSRSWHTTSTPDIAFHSQDLDWKIKRVVGKQLGGSDHRPIFLIVENERINNSSMLPRWNYKKANWMMFKHRTSVLAGNINITGKNINTIVQEFNTSILQAAKEAIPRGARRNYKPYWNKDLDELDGAVEGARTQAEQDPSQEHHNAFQQAKARFQRGKLQAQRKSWKEKTASLNFEKDGKKLWNLVKGLNDEGTDGNIKVTLQKDGQTLTNKQAANTFADIFAKDCNIEVSPGNKREARSDKTAEETEEEQRAMMNKEITRHELDSAIRKLKLRKSPGADGITNEMIRNLGSGAMNKLLEIYNISWKTEVPQIWREAIMVPIPKNGKDRGNAGNYRPISLTSCLCKTMERIINHRMKWYLESNQLLADEQAGFRQCYSTEDQATYLSQDIEDAFQDKKQVLAVWIDLRKAFDKVWKDGLLRKLRDIKVTGRMYRWTKSFLHNRRARVQLDGCQSKKVLLRHGVPQGGVISPTLFLVFINDLVKELPCGIRTALYADDLVMWCTEEYATVATARIQRAINILAAWTDKWCVTINKDKSSTTLFTLSTKQTAGTIKLNDTPIREDRDPTYLGVTFDTRLTWRKHIEKAETRARRKLAILRKLSGTSWGATERLLKNVYQQGIRPHLEYGSTAWSSASSSATQMLDKVQNQALRIITGAMRSTPITEMEKLTQIQPLDERRETKIMIQAEKFRSKENHPMKEKFGDLARGRLKRSSFIHKAKRLRRQQPELPEVTIPLSSIPECTPWREDTRTQFEVCTEVKGVFNKGEQNDVERRVAVLSLLDDKYPSASWVRVYTDGSAQSAVRNGGAGVYIEYCNSTTDSISLPTGTFCNNYGSETKALMTAVGKLKREDNNIVILTDAKSVLEALQAGKSTDLEKYIAQMEHQQRLILQWIPAHCGVPGNEKADQLAKRGSELEQPQSQLTFNEKKTLIKQQRKQPTSLQDDYHLLNREGQVIIFRLRTGHNRLHHHMFNKFRIGISATCECRNSPQNTEHILQECTLFRTQRETHWPDLTGLNIKLYGALPELQRTVEFIKDINLQI